jgi:hypothetical protein
MHTRPSSRSGTTLIEVVMGLTLFTAFAASAFLAIETSSRSYRTESVIARLDARAREALDDASGRLREADFDSVTPEPVVRPASASSVDFQRTRSFVNGGVVWGPTERLAFEYDPIDPDDGLDNDGDGLTDEGRLVWTENPATAGELRSVLCSHVSESLEGELPGNGLDDNGNGLVDERGFCIEFVGSQALVRITLEESDGDGNLIRQSSSRAVMSRNTPED